MWVHCSVNVRNNSFTVVDLAPFGNSPSENMFNLSLIERKQWQLHTSNILNTQEVCAEVIICKPQCFQNMGIRWTSMISSKKYTFKHLSQKWSLDLYFSRLLLLESLINVITKVHMSFSDKSPYVEMTWKYIICCFKLQMTLQKRMLF